MSSQAGPFDREIPGERHIADYHNGQLTLTDRRVVYRRKGPDRMDIQSLRLAEVDMVGITRRQQFPYGLLVAPLILIVVGFLWAGMESHPAPFFLMSFIALLTLPVPLAVWGFLSIHIATPGHRLRVRVPRRHRPEAQAFVQAVDAARFANEPREESVETLAPTTHPFHG